MEKRGRMTMQRVLATFFSALVAAPAVAPGQDLVLTNATLIDGTGAAPLEGVSIVIDDGRISSISSTASAPSAERVVDLQSRFVIPGLIDSHTHILSPGAAERALLSGVTTARVPGDRYLRGLGTRDLIRGGHMPGPELLCAGAIVRPVLGEFVINAFPEFGRFLDEPLQGTENVSAVVRALLDRGADVIKVGASERAGLATTEPRKPELTEAEIEAAVREAASEGKYVAAHAHAEAGAEAAVRAGVRSIEHGTYMNERTLDLMKEKGTYLVPTLAIMSPLGDPQSDDANDIALRIRTWHMQTALREVVRKAHAMGVPIAASTDGSYGDGDDTARVRVAHEIEELIAIGMSPLEAVTAATWTGAQLLGVSDRTGKVSEGFEADLVVLDRSPLEDPRVLYEPLIVVNNGVVVLDRYLPNPYNEAR
jgi:imidazolonepropionase-like amidohydrolase